MNITQEIKFPCGYEKKIIADGSGMFGAMRFKDDGKLPLCPLHGKECKR